LAAGNLTDTTDNKSYHGSTDELPPATSHGYAEWDFFGVPDPVMFQWFLDAADYWFGYSDNSNAGVLRHARQRQSKRRERGRSWRRRGSSQPRN
jgi:hypothetical protein